MSTSILCAMPSADPRLADHILFRIYCINRIRASIKIIKQLTPNQLSVVDKPMVAMGGIHKDKSVLQLWDDLKQYKYLYDTTFFPYMLCRVLLVLVQSKKIPYSTLQKDFSGIDVEEFLSAIDVVVNHAHQVNQHYHNSGLSFNDWIKRYWWVPSLFALSVCIKVLKYYYLDSELDHDFSYPLRSPSKLKGF